MSELKYHRCDYEKCENVVDEESDEADDWIFIRARLVGADKPALVLMCGEDRVDSEEGEAIAFCSVECLCEAVGLDPTTVGQEDDEE